MSILNTGSPGQAGSASVTPQADIAPSIAIPSRAILNAPAGLSGRGAAIPVGAGLAPRIRLEQAPVPYVGPPLVPYPLPPAVGKVLVALDSEFSSVREAEITTWQVVMGAEQGRMKAHLAAMTHPPGDRLIADFAGGHLEHVYVKTRQYRELAAASRNIAGNAQRFPVYIDRASRRVVVDVSRSFRSDDLTLGAREGLVRALGITWPGAEAGPATPGTGSSRRNRPAGQEMRRMLRQHKGAAHHAPKHDRLPVRPYAGAQIRSTTPGADFFKENHHPLIGGRTNWLKDHIAALAHPHYLEADDPKALGKDLVSHRGVFDNRNGVPENSIAALDKAYEQGFRSVELDVMVTSDRVPVLLHDFTTGRMTDDPSNRLVSHVKFDELAGKNLVIRNPLNGDFVVTDQHIASLEQALDHVRLTKPGMSIYLDCKEATGEAVVDLLLSRPELRPFTALKVYLEAYSGGFDQFLGDLYLHHGIDPVLEVDRPRRIDLRKKLSTINVVPVLSPGHMNRPGANLARFFPPDRDVPLGVEALANSGMAWLRSWSAMRHKVVQAVDTRDGSVTSKAMHLIRERLAADKDFGFDKAALAAVYRYEDFSVRGQSGSSRYFNWGPFGGMSEDRGADGYRSLRATAGGLRHEGENVLTDQPSEEAWAIAHDITLPRGHSGLELNVPPGTTIDLKRDAPLVALRTRQFLAEDKLRASEEQIQAVRDGARADAAALRRPLDVDASDETKRSLFPAVVPPLLAAGGLLGWRLVKGSRRRVGVDAPAAGRAD